MDPEQRKEASGKDAPSGKDAFSVSAPALNLPKGGGAVRGIGEKFAANPVTGSGAMSVPLASSPGRSGFGPQLSLSYDSAAGNGPFGFGWNLSLASPITRKTDKGLPQYFDAQDSDVFILSGAEDLVQMYRQDGTGAWVRNAQGALVAHEDNIDGYHVRRYRPRIEGLFARIERWTRVDNSHDVHWRSISKDNILTLYGADTNSRIVDPADPSRIFSWLICETRDDKGNAVRYRYKAEDGAGVDLGCVSERNRGLRDDIRRTATRYLKHIYYGNRAPLLDDVGNRPRFLTTDQINKADWMFEVVFDYGEHNADSPTPNDPGAWTYRSDPFSSYRSGFEVRTTRRCQRVLMFHHFPDEAGVGRDCLVRSTDFTYSDAQDLTDTRNPVYTFLQAVTQTGYRRNGASYDQRSLPPVEFEYSQPIVQEAVHDIDAESLKNLPIGVEGSAYQWTDLHGEGIPGILTEHGGAWFYKRNLSPVGNQPVEFAPLECVATKPNLALAGGAAQFMDLAGDGQPDLVVLDGPMPGRYEHDEAEGWQGFQPFTAWLNRDMRDPNLKFVDLDGDGHADVLITEDEVMVWHASLAEQGFGPARRVAQALDEEHGPRLVFADGTQSIYLADLSGDGLTDLVRIRNGAVCYWPNLGYGRFGAKVAMDQSPNFDNPDQFDHKRIRLADIDGSGTTDIIYLHRDGVRLYFNQSGNGWSAPQALRVFPRVDDLASIVPTDLLGNGTACLVWSSPLPGDAQRQMRYVDLMGGQKPHLLVKTTNNLGAETRVHYAHSTKFYLQDKRKGKPWITKLPFPVHVVEKVETFDHISRNHFVTRYAYHHGYFDGVEHEFRGFGMVEQWDTEEFAAFSNTDSLAPTGGEGWGEGAIATNIDAASHVPPIHTKTWFHTGVYLGRERISRYFAGLTDAHDHGEYYREPGLDNDQVKALLLPDTMLPAGLTIDEEREACRALKGAMLRQEVYALDGTPKQDHPYTVTEQNFTIERLQPQADNRHAVFFTHPREALTFHYERDPSDPRVQHALTLAVDNYGNVLKAAAIGYGRRKDSTDAALLPQDRAKQRLIHITCSENDYTNALVEETDSYRTPLPAEARSYELRKAQQEQSKNGQTKLFGFDDVLMHVNQAGDGAHNIDYEDDDYTRAQQAVANDASEGQKYFRRLIEQVRTLYRPNDLGAAHHDPLRLLPLKTVESLALPGESYKLAFTPGLLNKVYVRDGLALLPPNPAAMLAGGGASGGGYVELDSDQHWWLPAGRMFLSQFGDDSAVQELAYAREHFFLPQRYRDPFHTATHRTESVVTYDTYDLLLVEKRDALDNRVTVGERDAAGQITVPGNNYRVLQPWLVTDPNRNRAQVAFDVLGMVAGTAVMGKPQPALVEGDTLQDFAADLTPDQVDALYNAADPHVLTPALLQGASTRIVYDLHRFHRTQQAHPDDPTQWLPVYAATLARETHASDPMPTGGLKIQLNFSYSDGYGREIQKKIQAEPEQVDGINGPPRWVGSGWTIFNNKGKPVRQYEPFFSATQRYEFGVQVGVSPVLFYDPAERVVATLHPNHTYAKVLFDPWQQTSYDVNDTVAPRNDQTGDPRTDPDIKGYVAKYFAAQPSDPAQPWQTWHQQRSNGALGAYERTAAQQAAAHADTPSTAHIDALGRTFLTIARNRVACANHPLDGTEETFATHVELDIEGNQRAVIDAKERIVMRYAYDLLGNRIYQLSMEAGARWMLNDVSGKAIYAWDSRDHHFRSAYDTLRRPINSWLREGSGSEILIGRSRYGETQTNPEANNLRGKVVQVCDQAGVVSSDAYDFKGNALRSQRQLAQDYKNTLDWQGEVALEPEVYISSTRYDALNRPVLLTAPDSSVIRPGYNDANLLDTLHVALRGAATATPFVTNIDYDAKGQRQRIDYGNGVRTNYAYDPLTFRLINLRTTRGAAVLQDLAYHYDPGGNITHLHDDAQQQVYFNNAVVEPHADYVYDALYRLISAHSREHIGQLAAPQSSWNDEFRVNQPHPSDGAAMRNYTEQYEYDAVGNFLHLIHQAGNNGWTRAFRYQEASLIEPEKQSNRLSGTQVGESNERYNYNAHGSMLNMPHLSAMHWDFHEQLRQVDLGGGGTAYYVYDTGGQRVRKVIERQNGTRHKERLYLGGFEVYREYDGSGAEITLARDTLHVMDDKQRIALVETLIEGDDGSPAQLIRYQFGNHLGSASLELNSAGEIISYEEYTPYGSTAYQAVNKTLKAAAKRYRYTGKERDEETGFTYHGARYYAAWVGRWVSADPSGLSGGICLFAYAQNRPTIFSDPTGNFAWVPILIGVLAVVMFSSDATGPTTPKEAEQAKPRMPWWEFAGRTAVLAASTKFAGTASGLLGGSPPTLLRGLVAGAAAGSTNEVGSQVVDDIKEGAISSPEQYGSRAIRGGATGAVLGTVFAGVGWLLGQALGKVASLFKKNPGGVASSTPTERPQSTTKPAPETTPETTPEATPETSKPGPKDGRWPSPADFPPALHPSQLPKVIGKVVAGTAEGPNNVAGYGQNSGVPGVYNPSSDVWAYSIEMGQSPRPFGGMDSLTLPQGKVTVGGLWISSHAERGAWMLNPNSPVTVSRMPCMRGGGCFWWFRDVAVYENQWQMVAEPSATWFFGPGGQVTAGPPLMHPLLSW